MIEVPFSLCKMCQSTFILRGFNHHKIADIKPERRHDITGPDGTIRPLVSETHVIGAGEADEPEKDIWDLFTPLVCAWLLFGIVLGFTWIEWRKKKYFLWVDCVLFSVSEV